MDFVPNHTSDEHDWFKKSVQKNGEFTDYYIWKDAKNQKDVMKNSSVIPIAPNNWVTYKENKLININVVFYKYFIKN